MYTGVIKSIINPIQEYLPDSIETNNFINDAINIDLLRTKTKIGTTVFMSHGLMDKRWRDGKFVKHFDYICVSGPLWMEKMINEGIAKEKILITGYPKLDPIFQGKLKKDFSPSTKILWAPTHNIPNWTIRNASSYPEFEEYLNNFPDNFEVITSLHPGNKPDRKPIFQELIEADLIISDCSSIIFETWAINKPVIMLDWLVKERILKLYPHSFEEKIYKEKIGYHADNFNHLLELIDKALDEGIDAPAKEFIEEAYPTEFRGRSGELTAKLLNELAI